MPTADIWRDIRNRGVENTLARRFPDPNLNHPFQRSHLNTACARCGHARGDRNHGA